MYDIVLSVAACLRSGTRADVAWMVSPRASDEAVAFTPGGGRLGVLAEGAFDGLLADVAERRLPAGRLVQRPVNDVEAASSGLPAGTQCQFLVVPAEQFPPELWQHLLERRPVAIWTDLDGDVVTDIRVATSDDDGPARDLLLAGAPSVQPHDGGVLTVMAPVTRLVVAGRGPIAEALAAQGRLMGWRVSVDARPESVAGLAASLSWLDAVVVMGHDVESSGRCLLGALEGDAGYIGALGSHQMQQARADWLAYRDITDVSRIHGPAGLDIGATSPAEIAVSITAQIVATLHDL